MLFSAYALSQVANDILAKVQGVMRTVFDRPTNFAINSLRVEPATKHSLMAAVEFKAHRAPDLSAASYWPSGQYPFGEQPIKI